MNIVFFVESYHHKALTNGVCVKKVADALISKGHTVTVFTSSSNTYDLPKFERIDGVDVYRIKRSLEVRLGLYLKFKNPNNRILKLFQKLYLYFIHLVTFNFWPLRAPFCPYRYYRKAKKVLKSQKIDVIIGTYLHIEEVLAAIKLKKKNKNALLITYTLDSLVGRNTPVFFNKQKYAENSMKKWQKYVFKKSDKIFVMESHRTYYSNYENQILEKIQYTDIPLLDIEKEAKKYNSPALPKNIVYTGFTSRQTGSAKYLIELIANINEVNLHIYGKTDDEVEQALQKSGLLGNRIFMHGYVDYETSKKAQKEADFLVTFGSQKACMISGKIFDYISRGKPIICFYQNDEDTNKEYLKKYPNILIMKEYVQEYDEAVKLLKDFINRTDFENIDMNCIFKTFYKNTPQATAELIINSVKR